MRDWTGKHVLVIGAARQGQALTRHLVAHGARVTLNDQKPTDDLNGVSAALIGLPVELVFGSHPMTLLDSADLVCVSGGVPLTLPLIMEAYRRGIPVTNDSQLFMESVPCPVIGITGSAGKTTTTTLVGRMAQAAVERGLIAHPKAWVGGNIGTPLIDHLDEIGAGDLVILELSSFQLELMTTSPHLATVLNITPNHLDRHASMAAYTAAKQRILDFQGDGDVAVLNREDPGAWGLMAAVKGRLTSFGLKRSEQPGTFLDSDQIAMNDGSSVRSLFPRSLIELRGQHNLINVIAAAAIAWSAGIPVEAMAAALTGFSGVPHRLEFVRTYKGARWYNDSIATAPERTIADIHAFDEPLILLLGGRDKNLPWEDLAGLVKERVKHVILFGEAAAKISDALAKAPATGNPVTVISCANLEEAVQVAASFAVEGDVILLAPGGTSYDHFVDFEERGDRFKQWVNKLS
jgi:UDP-N-acetylmuramoylalanine--D-glutamate ligase